jgi:hypothetical protein
VSIGMCKILSVSVAREAVCVPAPPGVFCTALLFVQVQSVGLMIRQLSNCLKQLSRRA